MSGRGGALLVVGGTSGAGKSTLTTALCRSIARRFGSVAPFKAQNMSNHAAVTADGGEVGRAQAMQAAAARVDVERRMNPILLKPTAANRSHVVVLGDELSATDAVGYGDLTTRLKPVVLEAITSLRSDHDWVIGEGAGGAAEINLFDRDLVNLPLARAAGIPAILVVDIDRGGAFAMAHGSIDLLPPDLRATVAGVVFNRFRGDVSLLDPGIEQLEQRTGVPVLGVLPHLGDAPLFGVEDSLDVGAPLGPARSATPVRVAAIRFPHLANPSDLDPLVAEPDVTVRWATRPGDIDDADLIVLPGSRATVADLAWMRETGLDEALVARDPSTTVIGLCAGYQMLGREIDDPVESGVGRVDGLGLLPSTTRFEPDKIVRRSHGRLGSQPLSGYQIRFGRPSGGAPWLEVDGEPEGATGDNVSGTSLHGLLDADGFRTALLADIAASRARSYAAAPATFAQLLDAQHDRLADWLDGHLDVDRLLDIARTADSPEEVPGW